jgi:threonine synthase
MPVVVSKALEFGASTVCIMSAGNAASSLATYAARAGLEAVVVMREGAPAEAQLAPMLMLGAKAVLLEDPRDDVFFAPRDKYGWYDCDGQVNPFRLEGKKTCTYAIWTQLDRRLPDRKSTATSVRS